MICLSLAKVLFIRSDGKFLLIVTMGMLELFIELNLLYGVL
jgi:hypothetical protein